MSTSYSTWFRRGVSLFFEYDTPRIVHIESKKVGVLSRLVQALILSYIIGYVIVYQKGYQQFCQVESAVTTKVKGIAFTNYTDKELINVARENRYLYNRIWDVTDYVIPPVENNAFFVMTNVIITPNQTLATCPEDPNVHGYLPCNRTRKCVEGDIWTMGHGVNTGKCVKAVDGSGRSVCEIRGWCPVERDQPPLGPDKAVLEQAANFTVLIKNHVEFPLYGMRRSNILDSSNKTYLASCLYNNETDPFCPVFRLRTMVESAGQKFSDIAVEGAVISVIIDWECDLDHDFKKHCRPEYSFRRLDVPDAKIAPGYNFRHSEYYGDHSRTLFKSYGILFVVDVQGRAGKFSFIPFFINLGAGLALLSLATVVCDIIVLYFLKDRKIYRDKKYLLVKGSDAFEVYRELDDDNFEELQSGSHESSLSARSRSPKQEAATEGTNNQ